MNTALTKTIMAREKKIYRMTQMMKLKSISARTPKFRFVRRKLMTGSMICIFKPSRAKSHSKKNGSSLNHPSALFNLSLSRKRNLLDGGLSL